MITNEAETGIFYTHITVASTHLVILTFATYLFHDQDSICLITRSHQLCVSFFRGQTGVTLKDANLK